MKKLFFKGKAIELNVVNVSDDEFESINDGEVDVEEIRDEMDVIYTLYNIIPEEGEFLDEDDNPVEIDTTTLYGSNIGEPLGDLYNYTYDDLSWGFESHIEDEGEKVEEAQVKLVENKQFIDEDGELILVDSEIKKLFQRRMATSTDLYDVEQLVSVVSTEEGYWEIEIPEGFDLSKRITICTHEIEHKGIEAGLIILQYNNGKLLTDELVIELDSSETEETEVFSMTEIEYDGTRLMSEEIDEIYL